MIASERTAIGRFIVLKNSVDISIATFGSSAVQHRAASGDNFVSLTPAKHPVLVKLDLVRVHLML